MLVKFMPKGRCGLDYCLGKTVRGVDPRAPEVLQGNPEQAAQVIKSLDFANPFTSVVLTYERKISAEEAARDIAAFEEMLLPGMKGGLEYDRVWIRHTEHPKDPATKQPDPTKPERTALHCIIPNVHLPTGKRLQPYFDRVDRKRVEAWQELTNEAHGYASAKDPERRRSAVLNLNRLPQSVADLKNTLTEAVIANVQAEQINTRADLTAWLKGQGFGIERTTKNSISISHPTLKKNLRLEGELYELGGIESAASARDAGEIPPYGVRQIESDKYRRDLAEGLERKRAELQERFARRNEKGPRILGGNDQGREAEMGASSQTGRSADSRDQAEISPLGERGLAPGVLGDGRADRVSDLGEREQGDRRSPEQLATDRGGEIGGSPRADRDGTKRGDGLPEDSRGRESRDRQTRAVASRSEGEGQPHHELPGEERGNLRGGASERPALHLGAENSNSGQTEQLSHERHTIKPLADGIGLAGIVTAFRAGARQTLDRVRAALERARYAIANGFRAGRECLPHFVQHAGRVDLAARSLGQRLADLDRASGRLQERGTEHEGELRKSRSSFQLDGVRIGRDKTMREVIQHGIKIAKGVHEIRARDARDYGNDRGISR